MGTNIQVPPRKLAEIYKYYFSNKFLPKPQMKKELNISSDNIV